MILGYKHNISCSFRYHHPTQSLEWNQQTYGDDHFPRGVGVNLNFWSWWSGQESSVELKKKLDHRWLFEDRPTTPENLLKSLHEVAGENCVALCLVENEHWAVATDRKSFYLIYREKDFSGEKEFHFSKQIDDESGLLVLRAEARQNAFDYQGKNTGFIAPLVGYKQTRFVRPDFVGSSSESVQHGVLFSFPIVWP